MIEVTDMSPRWVDLAQGARVLLVPPGEAEIATASAWANQAMDRVEAVEVLDEKYRNQIYTGLFARGIARLCIKGWEGVKGECTPDGAASLIQMPGQTAPFVIELNKVIKLGREEGNGSGAAPNGTSAAAPDTAGDAAPQESDAVPANTTSPTDDP